MCDFTSCPLCLSVESSLSRSLGSELGSGGVSVTSVMKYSMLVSRKQACLNIACVSPTSTDLGVSSCAGTSKGEMVDTRFLTLGSQPSKRNVPMSQSYGPITAILNWQRWGDLPTSPQLGPGLDWLTPMPTLFLSIAYPASAQLFVGKRNNK